MCPIHERLRRKQKLDEDIAEFEKTFQEKVKSYQEDQAEYIRLASQILVRMLEEKSQNELVLRYLDFSEAVSKNNGTAAEYALRSIFRLEKKC